MKGLLKQWKRQRCEVLVEEDDVPRMLQILLYNGIGANVSIGAIDWGKDIRWAIAFDTSLKKMSNIESDIKTTKLEEVIVIKNVRKLAELVRLP